ncbi:hypothetical protein AAFF_G00308960 [Aldrovandia affinis]|uniref:Uncharacterized protein n=1 Tax=Aldrovandia affinis TaxID=143900 RepID=A0AAD7SPM8_9TELE|nr:hypothetical protein AAFF_G00308960 [Aldrovandia affinis]
MRVNALDLTELIWPMAAYWSAASLRVSVLFGIVESFIVITFQLVYLKAQLTADFINGLTFSGDLSSMFNATAAGSLLWTTGLRFIYTGSVENRGE